MLSNNMEKLHYNNIKDAFIMESLKDLLINGSYRNYESTPTILQNPMRIITKATSIGIPAFIGLGLAWVGIRVISNEKRLEKRRMELQLQLDAKSILDL